MTLLNIFLSNRFEIGTVWFGIGSVWFGIGSVWFGKGMVRNRYSAVRNGRGSKSVRFGQVS